MLSDSADMSTSAVSTELEGDATSVPWLQGRDVLVGGLVLFLWLVAVCLPERRWPSVSRWLARRRLSGTSKLSDEERKTLEAVITNGDAEANGIEDRFRAAWLAHKYLSWIFGFASNARTSLIALFGPMHERETATPEDGVR